MYLIQKTFAAFSVLIFLSAVGPALAQDAETEVDEIIVEARLSGAPTWEVTRGGSTLLLVGAIQALPKDLGWRPDALERVAARADRVLFSQSVDVSPWDIMRMIWRSRTLTRLPGRTTSADYLAPEWQARLDAVEARHDEDFSTTSFFVTASGLMFNVTGLRRDRGLAADEVVRRTARRGRTPSERVGRVRGDEVIDDLLQMPPERWTPCIQKAIAAAEAGEEGMLGRAQAWRRFDVPGVMDSALEDALSSCWPWGDPEYGERLRGEWNAAVTGALAQDGVTLAVAPLRVLAEPDGVLDTLKAEGFEIVGPAWKSTDD